jgi:hypothetical protein
MMTIFLDLNMCQVCRKSTMREEGSTKTSTWCLQFDFLATDRLTKPSSALLNQQLSHVCLQFKISNVQCVLLLTFAGGQCSMGTFVLCAMLDKGPKLFFSCGTGEYNGGGFGGEAVEVEANICEVLKAADVEGKLTPPEFLAVLLSFCTASEHWQYELFRR